MMETQRVGYTEEDTRSLILYIHSNKLNTIFSHVTSY
jgi:hypothetical protein